jgi:hypothetical protein
MIAALLLLGSLMALVLFDTADAGER